MKKLVLILLLLPVLVVAQDVKKVTHVYKKKTPETIKGFVTMNAFSQQFTYNQSTFLDIKSANGYAAGGGMRTYNKKKPDALGFMMGLQCSPTIIADNEGQKESVTYWKGSAGLVVDKHLGKYAVIHAEAGLNGWVPSSTKENQLNTYGSAGASVGAGIRWVILCISYEYGLGNYIKTDNYGGPSLNVRANTFTIGLVIFPTGI